MKQIDYYNLNKITSIHIYDKYKVYRYVHHDIYKNKTWWFSKPTFEYDVFVSDDGYDECCYVSHTRNDIKNIKTSDDQVRLLVIGDEIYEKARSIVKFSNGDSYTQLFDTIEEADIWSKKLLKTANIDDKVLRIN